MRIKICERMDLENVELLFDLRIFPTRPQFHNWQGLGEVDMGVQGCWSKR
jgi:hypothetical protein